MSGKNWGAYNAAIAADFIARHEGFRAEAYKCPAGVWTIGYGHTAGVKEGDTIDEVKACELLVQDLAVCAREFARWVNRPVTEGQYVALLSLIYNVGVSHVVHKCPKLMRALNTQNDEACADEFLDITTAGGVELPGLVKRRQAEHDLFLN